MRYRVTHLTEYAYGDMVPLSHNLAHLRPRDTERQTCHACEIEILPEPAVRHDRLDFFGNHSTHFAIQEPHQRLHVEAHCEVEVAPYAPPADLSITWEEAVEATASELDAESLDARQFAFDSPYVARCDELLDYALPCFTADRPLFDATLDLTRRIHREFRFDSTVTTVGTPVLEVLRYRHGVCQDFAHLMIGCLRSLGLSARYVSGYLLTLPRPGMPRLRGADASHAWVAVYFPGHGWIDFDPTNGLTPGEFHVTLGWARDYEDIGPVKGVIVGGHRHGLHVSVDVEPLDPIPDEIVITPAAKTSAGNGDSATPR